MAGVSVNTGPITATRRARDIPKEKWNLLISARQSFVKVHIPADCRQLFDFIEEARDEQMWEYAKRLDPATGEWLPYADLNDLIQNGLGIDPELAEWAIEGLKALSPEELDRAVSLNQAVAKGQLSRKEQKAQTTQAVEYAIAAHPDATQERIAEVVGLKSQGYVSEIIAEISANATPKLLNHGGNHGEQDSNNYLAKDIGRGKPYILARLERDGHEELLAKVRAGKLSARKAGVEAGFIKPEPELTALKRHWKKASSEEQKEFLAWVCTDG